MNALLPLLENLAGPYGIAGVVLALTSYSLVRHALPKLIEKGPDYIAQLTAYRVAMAALDATSTARQEQVNPPLIFPSRMSREISPPDEERRAA